AAVVAHLVKVAFAQAKQNRAVELGVAADEVLLVGLVRSAVLVEPQLVVEVALVAEHLAAVPVLRLTEQIAGALVQQGQLAGRGELVGERSTARTGSDDDHVVVVHHSSCFRSARSGMSTPRWRPGALDG